jgi:hypothetical protein
MAKLMLKEFRCVEDTDESGSESPYFLVFIGDLVTGKTDVKRIKQGNWDDEVDKGELWVINAPVPFVHNFSFKTNPTLILVALIEEDVDVDISNAEVNSFFKPLLDDVFQNFKNSGATKVTSGISSGVASAFSNLIGLKLGNDDNMGVKRLKPTGQTGLQPILNYFADTGHYRVRFEIQ